MKLLSIIIPIYKVEEFIEECLESVISQNNSNVEIIIVNDGSPDNSMEIARKYIANYQNLSDMFHFIEQENMGLSGARNTGLNNANGKYIAFLDSDDLLANDYIETLLGIIQEFEPDLIEFNAEKFWRNGLTEKINLNTESGLFDNSERRNERVFRNSLWYCCFRVYKKEIFKDVRFPMGMHFEDVFVMPQIYFLNAVNKVYQCNKVLVKYRINQQGISNSISFNETSYQSLIKICDHYLIISDINRLYFLVFEASLLNLLIMLIRFGEYKNYKLIQAKYSDVKTNARIAYVKKFPKVFYIFGRVFLKARGFFK